MKTRLLTFTCTLLLTLVACGIPSQTTSNLPAATAPPTADQIIETAEVPPSPSPLPPTATPPPVATATSTSPPPTPTRRPPPEAAPLVITHISMADLTTGWATGEFSGDTAILRTGDGGQTWQDVSPPSDAQPPSRATGFFADAETAWVIYTGAELYGNLPAEVFIWHTSDGGQTWEASAPLSLSEMMETFYPSHIYFVDGQHGWMLAHLGAGMMKDYIALYQTTDGGANWAIVLDPTSETSSIQACPKTGLVFADAQYGLMTRACGGLMAETTVLDWTTDGGVTWESQLLPPPPDFPDLFRQGYCDLQAPQLAAPEEAALVARCADYSTDEGIPRSFLYTTTDGGENWDIIPFPGVAPTHLTADLSRAFGRDIYASLDSGQTWTQVSSVNWEGQFSFVSGLDGWAVARAGEDTALVKTTDGGITWTIITPQVEP